ncbi:hypothetical protein HK099_001462 [Clydaea vesicula]|uniref:Uncharacterized protein n=1 Tax=Clydaea vesicula TaxID=447962 RepID=A0AAD5TWS9_9FUNG|nr:hypothetical protein HK099_001462 [Clydaea vesicula]KAJ3378198.1 hypothetical protein HDU92_007600 [Lobulomyces angularis]
MQTLIETHLPETKTDDLYEMKLKTIQIKSLRELSDPIVQNKIWLTYTKVFVNEEYLTLAAGHDQEFLLNQDILLWNKVNTCFAMLDGQKVIAANFTLPYTPQTLFDFPFGDDGVLAELDELLLDFPKNEKNDPVKICLVNKVLSAVELDSKNSRGPTRVAYHHAGFQLKYCPKGTYANLVLLCQEELWKKGFQYCMGQCNTKSLNSHLRMGAIPIINLFYRESKALAPQRGESLDNERFKYVYGKFKNKNGEENYLSETLVIHDLDWLATRQGWTRSNCNTPEI